MISTTKSPARSQSQRRRRGQQRPAAQSPGRRPVANQRQPGAGHDQQIADVHQRAERAQPGRRGPARPLRPMPARPAIEETTPRPARPASQYRPALAPTSMATSSRPKSPANAARTAPVLMRLCRSANRVARLSVQAAEAAVAGANSRGWPGADRLRRTRASNDRSPRSRHS